MKARTLLLPALLAACVTGGSYLATLSAPWAGTRAAMAQTEAATSAKPTPPVPAEVGGAIQELSRTFRAVHNSIKDAVVNIDTRTKKIPDEFRKLLPPGIDIVPDPGDAPAGADGNGARRLHPLGTGSGVIISADGYIATNNHVVEDADEIIVRLADGRELKARVIGRDPKTDLAVVKIDADKLTYAKLGDSDALEVGDWVLAFGSPFGFDQTMTQGIISAKGRQVPIIAEHNSALEGLTYENFLQTDAAINPGNSGGPLVNLKGDVVGINTAIASNSGAYNGIGFSIPSNDVKYITDSLIKTGTVVRGYMGVGIVDLHDAKSRRAAEDLGYTANTGVLVTMVQPDTPAGKGGLKAGDIITAVDGKPVESMGQFRTLVARTAPGVKIDLSVFREGKTVAVSFPLGTQPETVAKAKSRPDREPAVALCFNELGITVAEESGKGLVITGVDPNSLAADTGLAKGDVILNVQGKEVKTPDDLKAALAKRKLSEGLHVTVRGPDGAERFVFIEKQ